MSNEDNEDPDAPILLVVKTDASDGYNSPACFVERPHTLTRAGSIEVEFNEKANQFTISLLGDCFIPPNKPLLPRKPAVINLSGNAVFEIAQRCRQRWEKALASVKKDVVGDDGTAREEYPFDEKCEQPVDSQTFDIVARELALAGALLFQAIFEGNKGSSLDRVASELRNWARSQESTITIIAPDFHIPWRMLYTHPSMSEPLKADGSNYDAQGFWGYRHILEQFPREFAVSDYQLVAKGKELGFGAGLHERIDREFGVPCIERHRDFVQHSGNKLKYVEWTTIKAVKSGLAAPPFPLQIVYFLCHAEGAGTIAQPSLRSPHICIAGEELDGVDLRESINHRFDGHGPFVFVNACRGGHLQTLVSHNFSFAGEFMQQGAKGLLGPQIEVPAVFAGNFGKLFFEALMTTSDGDPPPLAGKLLRDLTRSLWSAGNPLGLIYSLYAGADCHIVWQPADVAA